MKIYPRRFVEALVKHIEDDIRLVQKLERYVPSHIGRVNDPRVIPDGNCDDQCQRCIVNKLHKDLIEVAANLDYGAGD
jgi:hypothetical protein